MDKLGNLLLWILSAWIVSAVLLAIGLIRWFKFLRDPDPIESLTNHLNHVSDPRMDSIRKLMKTPPTPKSDSEPTTTTTREPE
jgi:hypothetical protein